MSLELDPNKNNEYIKLTDNVRNKDILSYILLVILLGITLAISLGTFSVADSLFTGKNSDEGIYFAQAQTIKSEGFAGLKKIATEYVNDANLKLYPNPLRILHISITGFILSLSSDSIINLAYYSLFCFLATIVITFLFVKKFWDEKIALITSIFMAFSPLNLGLARRALMDSGYNLFTLISLALLVNFIHSKSQKNFIYLLVSLVLVILYRETSYFYLPFFVITLLILKFWGDNEIKIDHLINLTILPPIISFFVYIISFGGLTNTLGVFKGVFLPNILDPQQYGQSYGVEYCSGPWTHYFLDYFIVIPLISIIVFVYLGYYFIKAQKHLYTSLLIAFLFYFVITFSIFFKNIRYGVTLNFIYSLLAALALVSFSKIYLSKISLSTINKTWSDNKDFSKNVLVFAVILLSLFNLKAYDKIFLKYGMYDTVIFHLLKAEHMIPQDYDPKAIKEETNQVKVASEEIKILETLGKQAIVTMENPNELNYLNLSLYYFQGKLYQESVKMAEKVISINPKNIAAYNNLCAANIMLGDFDKAIEVANKALEIDPNYQLTKNNLQWAKDVKANSQKK